MTEPFVFTNKSTGNLVSAAMCGAGALACGAGLVRAPTGGAMTGALWLALPVGLALAALAVWYLRKARDVRPMLVMDSAGFDDRRSGLGPIPWSDVARIDLVTVGTPTGPRAFRLTIRPEASFAGVGVLKGREVMLFTYELKGGSEAVADAIRRLAPEVPRAGF